MSTEPRPPNTSQSTTTKTITPFSPVAKAIPKSLKYPPSQTTLTKPQHPHDFSNSRKNYIVLTTLLTITSGTLTAALPSGLTPILATYFSLPPTSPVLVLPTSLFLLGFALGPLFFSPLSETYGRRPVLLPSFILFTGSSLGCALAPAWSAFLVFRFLVGITASCPFAVITGLYADLYPNPSERGTAIMLINAVTTSGPILGPILGGFTANVSAAGWRLPFYITFALATITLSLLCWIPETFAPVITHKDKVNSTPRPRMNWATTLTRPVQMLLFHPLISATCAYLALLNAVYYLAFEAYPIIFSRGTHYDMPLGVASLPLLPIAIGALLSGAVFAVWDNKWLSRALTPEARRLPLACAGGPLFALGVFWLAWTAHFKTHWIWPTLAGLPFGLGIELVFMGLVNYVTDVYGARRAASANAASIVTRFLVAAALPMATGGLYGALGVGGAGSVLGAACVVMAGVPWGFLKWGKGLREKVSIEDVSEKGVREGLETV